MTVYFEPKFSTKSSAKISHQLFIADARKISYIICEGMPYIVIYSFVPIGYQLSVKCCLLFFAYSHQSGGIYLWALVHRYLIYLKLVSIYCISYLGTKCSKKEHIYRTCCGEVIILESNAVDEYAYFSLFCFCNLTIFVLIWEKGYF